MGENNLHYLDAQTKDGEYKITTFSYLFEDLIRDFSEWMKREKLTFSQMEYATIYRAADFEPVADLVLDIEGAVIFEPREPDKRLFHRVALWLRKRLT